MPTSFKLANLPIGCNSFPVPEIAVPEIDFKAIIDELGKSGDELERVITGEWGLTLPEAEIAYLVLNPNTAFLVRFLAGREPIAIPDTDKQGATIASPSGVRPDQAGDGTSETNSGNSASSGDSAPEIRGQTEKQGK